MLLKPFAHLFRRKQPSLAAIHACAAFGDVRPQPLLERLALIIEQFEPGAHYVAFAFKAARSHMRAHRFGKGVG